MAPAAVAASVVSHAAPPLATIAIAIDRPYALAFLTDAAVSVAAPPGASSPTVLRI